MNMDRVLIIATIERFWTALAEELSRAGLRVSLAPTGQHGLACIERDPPDLVVLGEPLSDMRSSEIRAFLSAHPPTSSAGVIVLSPPGSRQRHALLLDGPSDRLRSLLRDSIRSLLAVQDEPPGEVPIGVDSGRDVETAAIPAGELEPRATARSFAELGLEHLLIELARTRRTGLLRVSSFEGYFLDGRPVHASLAGRSGVRAFALLFRVLAYESGAALLPRFERLPRLEVEQVRRTIDADLTSLLASSADLGLSA